MQNRRQNIFNRGALQFCRGLDIKLNTTPLIYSVSHFNLGGLGPLFGGTKPTKDPRRDGTEWMSIIYGTCEMYIMQFSNAA